MRGDPERKERQMADIAGPETPWLDPKAEEPLKSRALNPSGSLPYPARQKLERSADPEHDGCVKPGQVIRHELLAHRNPKSHPE